MLKKFNSKAYSRMKIVRKEIIHYLNKNNLFSLKRENPTKFFFLSAYKLFFNLEFVF